MSDPLTCEVEPVGGDGLVDPELFVIRSVMLPAAASQIEAAGDSLTRMGDDLTTAMDSISSEWWKLPGCYEAPEASQAYLLLNPACEDADMVRAALGTAALLLADYSAAVAAEREMLRDLSARAEVFRREVYGTSWREDGGNIARNTALLEEHAAIAHRINAAAVECATGIYGLVGTMPDDFVPPEAIPEWALASPDVPMPWGYPAEEDRNWLESVGHVFWRFGNEFGTSVLGLTGYDTLTDERTGEFAGQAWAGLGNFLGSAVVSVAGAPLVYVAAQADPSERDGFMEWLVERNRVFTGAMAGMASVDLNAPAGHATDDWDEDPIAAAGYTVLNVGSLLAGVGVLSAGRAAVVAARVGAMSTRTARIVALAGQVGEFVIPATEIFTAGGIRVFAGLRNAIRLAEFDGLTIHPGAFLDDVARLADETPVQTTVSDEVFEGVDGGEVELGGIPDGELELVDSADLPEAPEDAPPSGPPSGGDGGSGGSGGGDPAPHPFEPDRPVPMTADAATVSRTWTQTDVDRALDEAPVNADGVSLDHRTGTPLDVTGQHGGVTLRWSEADGQWFVENIEPQARIQPGGAGAVDALTDSMRTAGPTPLDLSRADGYASGDVLRPGEHPPGTPAETFARSGGREGILHSKLRNGDGWRNYQHQISGWEPTADGLVPEFRRIDPTTGNPVDFDGRAARPDGRTAMLEAKFGHRELVFDPEGAFATRVRRQLPNQIADRLAVLGPDEFLEIHVSDPYGAAGIQEIVNGQPWNDQVSVVYTPAA